MLVLPASPWKRWCNWQPLRFALTSVLPLGFIATFLTLALTRGVSLLGLVLGIGIGLLAIGVVQRVWTSDLRC